MRVTALAGGVGAAKFLTGLQRVMDPEDLTIIGNTADDAIFHGLHVSPDLDTVMYTLSGVVGDLGWGRQGDTYTALEAMRDLGVDAWFTLGDSDLGTHLARTTWLAEGATLSEVTQRLGRQLGFKPRLLPMSDQPVRTKLRVVDGTVRDFQEYFVKHRHAEDVTEIWFEGAAEAEPAPGVLEAIDAADIVIISPSNPAISIGPILSVPGIGAALKARREHTVAITPLIQGSALKGPADRLMGLLGVEPTAVGVAKHYREHAATFVLDSRDADLADKIRDFDMRVVVVDTLMQTPDVAERMAKEILSL